MDTDNRHLWDEFDSRDNLKTIADCNRRIYWCKRRLRESPDMPWLAKETYYELLAVAKDQKHVIEHRIPDAELIL